jgi:hypothetical protein
MIEQNLVSEYKAFLKQTGYPEMSAEELIAELWTRVETANPGEVIKLKLDIKWLTQFQRKWEGN